MWVWINWLSLFRKRCVGSWLDIGLRFKKGKTDTCSEGYVAKPMFDVLWKFPLSRLPSMTYRTPYLFDVWSTSKRQRYTQYDPITSLHVVFHQATSLGIQFLPISTAVSHCIYIYIYNLPCQTAAPLFGWRRKHPRQESQSSPRRERRH